MNKKELDGELAICRSIFIVSLRDMLSSGANTYTKKCKEDAKHWLATQEETHFAFNNVIGYLFDDMDEELLRNRLQHMLKNRRIRGTRNLVKILTEINEEETNVPE